MATLTATQVPRRSSAPWSSRPLGNQARLPSVIRVAQYVRMSTEHQQYSSENQASAIVEYSKTHGMEMVRTYADHGKSGLNLAGRTGLKSLLQDVKNGNVDFAALLVYDVSRWGRFQDADESAYYEYVLKQAGIKVHYCAEPFRKRRKPPVGSHQDAEAHHGWRI